MPRTSERLDNLRGTQLNRRCACRQELLMKKTKVTIFVVFGAIEKEDERKNEERRSAFSYVAVSASIF